MTPFPQAHSAPSLFDRGTLFFKPNLGRNRFNAVCTAIAGLFASIAVLPLVLVLLYVLYQGGRLITPSLFTQLPPAPGMSGGGIGNAIIGTVVVTLIAALLALGLTACGKKEETPPPPPPAAEKPAEPAPAAPAAEGEKPADAAAPAADAAKPADAAAPAEQKPEEKK